jgi:uncharacterized SAM-binding protein YcdF (DUF218 family)
MNGGLLAIRSQRLQFHFILILLLILLLILIIISRGQSYECDETPSQIYNEVPS